MAFLDILDELTPADRIQLLDTGTELNVENGELIIEHQGENHAIYIIIDGEASVSRPAPDGSDAMVELARLGLGSIFGEMSFLTRNPATARVAAVGPIRLLVLEHRKVTELMQTEPELGGRFYRSLAITLASRLSNANDDAVFGRHLRPAH